MTVADTSILASLYLDEGKATQAAEKTVEEVSRPILLTPLTLLELRNAFNLAVRRGEITTPERDKMWDKIESQIADGFYQEAAISSTELHRTARLLSDRHTPKHGTRSLDLLHIASALVLKAKVFLSLDDRQRAAAKKEGLKILP